MNSAFTPSKHRSVMPKPVGLIERVREVVRYKHYSIRTEEAYVQWVRRFVAFHGKRHPRELGAVEVRSFLSHIASSLKVAAGTHDQALSALLFLYREVLEIQLPWLGEIDRPKKPKRLPAVLSVDEVRRLLAVMEGTHALMASLIYGTGMRLMECIRLRVKDVDFAHGQIIVRSGKGDKDRVTMLPVSLVPALRARLERVHGLWEGDCAAGRSGVYMPEALARKYPAAPHAWGWFWVFPARDFRLIPAAKSRVGTMCLSKACSVRSSEVSQLRVSPSPQQRTPCAILSPPTCCKTATTFALCKSCWAIPMWRRR